MDDIEARLRARLERLAAAVPVRSPNEVVVERVHPSAAPLRLPSPTLLVAALLVAAVAVGVGLVSRSTTPASSDGPSAIAPGSSPTGSTSPAPSPSNAGASLVVATTVEEPCPPTEGGGCHYVAVLKGPGARQWEWDLLADGSAGRPSALAPGTYTLRLEARYGSDVIVNGSPAPAGTDAVCATSFVVTPTMNEVPVTATFARGVCTVVVGSAPAPSASGAKFPACTTSQLAITTTNSSAAAGTVGVYLRFINRGNQTCSLHGWPTVIGVTVGGATLTARNNPVGYLPFPDLLIQTVSLKPGDGAFSSLSGGDNPEGGPGATCPPSYHTLRVTPPGDTEPVVLSAFDTWLGADLPACAGLWASPIVSAAQMNGYIVYPLRP